MKTDCSNCMSTITISFAEGTVSHTTKAHGQGSKRVESTTTTNTLFVEGDAMWSWEAPCCKDYWDSYERAAY